jgi:hypothetical protein
MYKLKKWNFTNYNNYNFEFKSISLDQLKEYRSIIARYKKLFSLYQLGGKNKKYAIGEIKKVISPRFDSEKILQLKIFNYMSWVYNKIKHI